MELLASTSNNFDLKSTYFTYSIDLVNYTQTNNKTKKSRNIRRIEISPFIKTPSIQDSAGATLEQLPQISRAPVREFGFYKKGIWNSVNDDIAPEDSMSLKSSIDKLIHNPTSHVTPVKCFYNRDAYLIKKHNDKIYIERFYDGYEVVEETPYTRYEILER